MILTLSDVKRNPDKTLYTEFDPKRDLINIVKSQGAPPPSYGEDPGKTIREYGALLDRIKYESDTVEANAGLYHLSYLEYLEKCWGDHQGIVMSPDIIWFTLLSEFASLVKADSKVYRHLFTDSDDKKEISVPSGSLTVMPLGTLVHHLRKHVPSDSSVYFPIFGFTKNSDLAFLSAFGDMCSPYYEYSMYLCGFPYIDVKGNLDDWKLLQDHWCKLRLIVQGNQEWVLRVDNCIDAIIDNVTYCNINFWKSIFSLKKCGSGHQTEVSGWFSELFAIQPRVKYVSNFPSHVSSICYKQLQTGQQYRMSTGLLSSFQESEFMVPIFSSVVFNITEV
jgi:hypothetical protein